MRALSICVLAGAIAGVTAFTGFASPYLPHNAFRYISELRKNENSAANNDENKTRGDEAAMKGETNRKQFFSPDSIRERYAEHIRQENVQSRDPLFDIARDTVELLRREGKTDDEIRLVLKSKFHFSDETINALMKSSKEK